MGMPWQLAQAKRPKQAEPRPIAECLPSINVNDLKIPRDYATITLPYIGLRYSQLASMRLTYHSVEVTHCTGRTQTRGSGDLFRARLDQIINMRHQLTNRVA